MIAALGAAAALALSGPAAATVKTGALSGEFDDAEPHGSWSATFSYDTSLGQITTNSTGNFQTLSWTASSGTPSPILWGTATDFPAPPCSLPPFPAPVTWDLTTATSFSILMAPFAYTFALAGPGWQLNIGESAFGNPNVHILPDDLPSFDTPFSSGFRGEYGGLVFDDLHEGSPATLSMRITVPEPATWAMMILGFLGVGAA